MKDNKGMIRYACYIVTLVWVTLKLTGNFNYSWWLTLAPTLFILFCWTIAYVICLFVYIPETPEERGRLSINEKLKKIAKHYE